MHSDVIEIVCSQAEKILQHLADRYEEQGRVKEALRRVEDWLPAYMLSIPDEDGAKSTKEILSKELLEDGKRADCLTALDQVLNKSPKYFLLRNYERFTHDADIEWYWKSADGLPFHPDTRAYSLAEHESKLIKRKLQAFLQLPFSAENAGQNTIRIRLANSVSFDVKADVGEDMSEAIIARFNALSLYRRYCVTKQYLVSQRWEELQTGIPSRDAGLQVDLGLLLHQSNPWGSW